MSKTKWTCKLSYSNFNVLEDETINISRLCANNVMVYCSLASKSISLIQTYFNTDTEICY